ncbi:electron transfer flavoprotein subunit alpha/FixB family protein [Desulfococcus multivorans]|jgi:electron transfer flavoprotein alpha subunit|nr:electron transfer flavoprotein subunit alpha/FixB family protein [Desulfococcus multivorans]AOY59208.1 EtfA4: electron transfer flavoprotein, subunit alpha [Desulfococcus multivorans]AQV01435.1 electron transfer flavoprotein subunit alpha [Desulfococcus multivorans]MDX9818144.1 electron transfer flavoprotein subunit alpha/FixB family protein [Desulfococcus multivorans]
MSRQVFAYIIHKNGKPDDTALEFATAARKLDPNAEVIGVVVGSGADLEAAAGEAAKSYTSVWKIDNAALAYPLADGVRKALTSVLPREAVVLIPHEHFGLDLAPGLAVKLDSPYLPDVVDFAGLDGDTLTAVRQEFSGMVSTHVACDIAAGAVITVRPGAFAPDESAAAGGTITDKSGDVGDLAAGRRYLETLVAEVGDVDITKSEILVSVGRGIEDQDNLEIVNDLARAMGADVSCSRPIVDAKWLEKSRQVGTSGQTVSPKVYLACGISGSFQHMGGIKGAPFIVAVNKNPKAPIFQVADVGIVADILEFLPELTEAVEKNR